MSDKTALGDRMKMYERASSGGRALPLLPICARLDGKRFSRFTKGLKRPYDPRLSALMFGVTHYLVHETQACVGYTQSDEISLIWHSTTHKRQIFLDGKLQKMVSVLASMCTARFNAGLPNTIPEKADAMALFDCRVFVVPTRAEATNVILWRERDATKNSISMAASEYYSHRLLLGKDQNQRQEMLFKAGVNWNDYPAYFKRGAFLQRHKTTRRFTTSELGNLPPRHQAHTNPDLMVERSDVRGLDLPPFGTVTNRVEVIFEGAEPLTAASGECHAPST